MQKSGTVCKAIWKDIEDGKGLCSWVSVCLCYCLMQGIVSALRYVDDRETKGIRSLEVV